MESKKTTELRGKKTSVRTKLAAAVAMLLVSTIMLTTTTYAWFVLSTVPEVKGMSTTVGSNGSLEIALLNDSTDTTAITSGVGDSSAADGDVVRANTHWGNIVDLSSDSYGLNAGNVKLYPAELNFAEGSQNKKLASIYSILKVPTYGTDGRVNTMNDNTVAGRYVNANFRGDHSYYGVRAIGTGTDADPTALAFQRAKNNFNSQITAAKNQALTSLNANAPGLITLAVKYNLDANSTFTSDELKPITDAASSLNLAADELKAAIQYAYEVYRIANKQTPADNPRLVTLETIEADANAVALKPYIENYNTLVATIATVKVPATGTGTGGAIVWADIRPSLMKLIDTMTLKFNDKDITKEEILGNLADFVKGARLSVSGGLYTDVANFTGPYTSSGFDFTVPIEQQGGVTAGTKVKDASLEIRMSVATSYGSEINALFGQLKPPAGDATALITDTYGYIVDLAVRCNAKTNLLLSAEAKNRVANDTATQGAGSTYTVNAGVTDEKDLKKVAQALRVVFVNNQDDGGYQILGVAGLTATGTPLATNDTGVYPLHMYTWETDANGGIKLKTTVTNDVITDMTADIAQCISVLVYLDGNYVDYAMGGVSGTLNLQFSSSTALTPMDYTFTTTNTTGLVISGDNTVVAGQNITLSATYNGQAASNVKWSVTSDNNCATINADSGELSATAAGTANVTATYTPAGAAKAVTATYTVTVTADN